MGLMDEIRAERPVKGPRCGVYGLRSQLAPGDWDDLVVAMADPLITSSAICKVLAKRSIRISSETVGRHRRGQCLCSTIEQSDV